MALILAIILIVILCSRISSDKASVAESNRRIDAKIAAYNERKKEWESQVYDVDVVYEITKMVERGGEEVEREVSAAFEEMILIANEFVPNGTKTEQTVHELTVDRLNRMKDNPKARYMCCVCDPTNTAVIIMLANRGKMRNYNAGFGISWDSGSKSGLWQDNAAIYYTGAVFVKWIDRQLRKHGIDEELYWMDGPLDGYDLDDKPHLRATDFCWEPTVRNPKGEYCG